MSDNAPLNLIHLANFNSTNIGNGALIRGLESTVEEDLEQAVHWHREPWDDYTFQLVDFDRAFVEKVNRTDGLIVGGAVTFNGRDYNDRTGTRFELPFELWSELKKPVVFYGLSYRHWRGQTYHHLDKLTLFIERILAADNMLLAVRNDGTKQWLKQQTGIDSPEIVEIPDSAIYVTGADRDYPEITAGCRNIMLSFNDEDADLRYNERFSEAGRINRSRDHVLDSMVSAVERLAERFPVNLVLCPHYFDDFRMMSDFIKRINPRLAHQRMVSTGLLRVAHTDDFYGRYKKADLAISMRVHSMSPCVGLGTPMVPFTTQGRMTNFLDRIGLHNQSVSAFDVNAADKLYDQAVHSLENPAAVRNEFFQARTVLRDETRNFHKRMSEFLAG